MQTGRTQRPSGVSVAAEAAPTFTNETEYAVILATWKAVMSGLSMYHCVTVASGETHRLGGSCTDEFIVETEGCQRIGKFRLTPAADHHRIWMSCGLHDIVWTDTPAQKFRLISGHRPPAGALPADR